jgi:fibronectin-binding autotransporter adhesin
MGSKIRTLSTFIASFLCTSAIIANPIIDHVAAGNVVIEQTPNTTTVNQSSQQAILNWQSFNIGAQEATHFNQPAGGIALNRINPTQGASQIYGVLTASGRIILVNPAGIYFGPGAYVNVGGLIATTSNISDQNFLAGNYIFDQASSYANPAIVNAGTIIAANHGMVALVGPNVTNTGMIQANMGRIALGGADSFTVVNFSGDGMINFAVGSDSPSKNLDSPSKGYSVSNTGTLIANAGQVMVSAHQASSVLDNIINLAGIVQIQSIYQQNGELIISGDPHAGIVRIAANINASGKGNSEKGGKVTITGYNILLDSATSIDVSGEAGGGDILVGGNYQGQGSLPKANALVLASNASLNADAITNGNGGNIILWSNNYTNASASISARGGSETGNGGFVETSGGYLNIDGIKINLSAAQGNFGTWLLDPTDVNITNGVTSGIALGGNIYTPNTSGATASVLNAGDLGTALQSANITVVTTNASGTGNGDITFNDPLNQLSTNWGTNNTILTLQADRNITMSSALTLNGTAQTLNLNAGQTNAAGVVNLNNTLNGSFALNVTSGSSGSISIAAAIGGTSALNSASFTGATTLGANVTTSGAQTYNNTVTMSGSRTLTGGTITLPAVSLGATTLTVSTSAANSVISGLISGTGGLTKAGAGTLTLNTANSYSGATTINTGTLKLGIANGIGSSSAVTLANTAGASFDLNNFNDTIGSLAGGGNSGGNVSLGSATLSAGNNNTTTSYAGVISGSGGLTKAGSGTLTLTGSNTFTGATTINLGSLGVGTNSLGSGATQSSSITIANGASLLLNFSNATFGNSNTITINGVGADITKGSLGTTNTNITTSVTLNNSIILGSNASLGGAGPLVLNGIVSDGGNNFALTKVGSGYLRLTNANTYTGATTVSAGILLLSNVNSLGSGATQSSSITIASGAALELGFGTATLGNTNPITVNGNGITTGSYTIGALSGGATVFFNSGIIANIPFGTVPDGTPILNNSILLGSNTTIGGGDATHNMTLNGVISDGGNNFSLTTMGANTITLGNANTYGGTTTVNSSTLSILNASGLGGSANGTVVNSGATLNLAGVNIGNENLTLNNATLSSTGTAGLSGLITLSNNSTDVINVSSGSLSLGGAINGNTAGNANLTLQGAGSVILGANIGTGNALSSLTANTGINLAANVTLNAATIALNNTVTGGNSLSLNGSNLSVNSLTVNNFTATGTGGSNSLTMATGAAQAWAITSLGAGTIASNDIAGSGNFSNIQNLTGGSGNDSFILNGGTLTGNVNGGGGDNTFTGNNTATTWNIAAANAFTVTGIGGNVSNIQNVTGGSNNNTFIFADNASISGILNGGSQASTNGSVNTLNYNAYTSPISVTLADNKFNGSTTNNGVTITNYTNINNIIGNSNMNLTITHAQGLNLVYTSATSGYIGDPVFWSGFSNIAILAGPPSPPAAPTSTSTTAPNQFNSAISSIIQQPPVNNYATNSTSDSGSSTISDANTSDSSNNIPNSTEGNATSSFIMATSLEQNLLSLPSQAQTLFDTNFSSVKISAVCN